MSGFYWDSANPTPVIEFAVSGSTVTVSTAGVCKVLFPKQGTNGLMQELDLSGRSYSCNFGAYPANASCGITDTADWASAMPWFVYLANANNTAAGVYCFVSRNPCMSVTPAAGLINDTDAVGATAPQTQNHINSFAAHDASVAAVPCLCIGSLTMTFREATDDWLPGALASTDGFGKFQEGVPFLGVAGQNGAEAGNYFVKPANNSPVFNTVSYKWFQRRDGSVRIDLTMYNDGGTDGQDATYLRPVLPLAPLNTIEVKGTALGATTITDRTQVSFTFTGGSAAASAARLWNKDSDGASLICSLFTHGDRGLYIYDSYQAF